MALQDPENCVGINILAEHLLDHSVGVWSPGGIWLNLVSVICYKFWTGTYFQSFATNSQLVPNTCTLIFLIFLVCCFEYCFQWYNFLQLGHQRWNSRKIPMASPHGRAMSCLLRVIWRILIVKTHACTIWKNTRSEAFLLRADLTPLIPTCSPCMFSGLELPAV